MKNDALLGAKQLADELLRVELSDTECTDATDDEIELRHDRRQLVEPRHHDHAAVAKDVDRLDDVQPLEHKGVSSASKAPTKIAKPINLVGTLMR